MSLETREQIDGNKVIAPKKGKAVMTEVTAKAARTVREAMAAFRHLAPFVWVKEQTIRLMDGKDNMGAPQEGRYKRPTIRKVSKVTCQGEIAFIFLYIRIYRNMNILMSVWTYR